MRTTATELLLDALATAAVVALFLSLPTCGRIGLHHPAAPAAAPRITALKAVYAQRLGAYQDATKDRAGWPSSTDCDGLLWAAVACAGGAAVDLSVAEYVPGELHRRPKASGECYPMASASTISRDPVAPWAVCQLRAGDRAPLERVLDYAHAHQGYIGLPEDLELTFLGPNLDGTLSRAAENLGGASRAAAANPIIELPGVKGYQQHNQAEEILLSAAVDGGATSLEVQELEHLVAGAPSDPLFQAALGIYTGDCDTAPRLLLDPATPVPSYVRGDQPELFAAAWWLRAAAAVLSHCKE